MSHITSFRVLDPHRTPQFEDMLFRSRQRVYGSEPPCISFRDVDSTVISFEEMRERMKTQKVDY
jgi:hypothetical protein